MSTAIKIKNYQLQVKAAELLIRHCLGNPSEASIEISQGQTVTVSIEDIDLLQSYNWWAVKKGNTYYAQRKIPMSRKNVYIHQDIMERILDGPIPEGMTVDHLKGNGLKNCRSDIELVTRAVNTSRAQKRKQSNDAPFL